MDITRNCLLKLKSLSYCLTAFILTHSLLGHAMTDTPSPLVFDAVSTKSLHARNFRSPAWLAKTSPNEEPLVLKGIEDLHASASAQFSESELKKLQSELPGKHIWLVDLRGESHGFVNGLAVSWYGYRNLDNQGLSLDDITKVESQQLQLPQSVEISHILKKIGGEIKELKPEQVTIQRIENEQALASRLGMQYVRIPVVDRHPPTPESVDRFVDLVRSLNKEDWLHLHCRAGKGRTTTFMVLYDILLNGKEVGVEDIIKRHAVFGPKDLRKLPNKPDNVWKLEPAKQRLAFIRDFYRYRNSDSFDNQSWQQWQQSKQA